MPSLSWSLTPFHSLLPILSFSHSSPPPSKKNSPLRRSGGTHPLSAKYSSSGHNGGEKSKRESLLLPLPHCWSLLSFCAEVTVKAIPITIVRRQKEAAASPSSSSLRSVWWWEGGRKEEEIVWAKEGEEPLSSLHSSFWLDC